KKKRELRKPGLYTPPLRDVEQPNHQPPQQAERSVSRIRIPPTQRLRHARHGIHPHLPEGSAAKLPAERSRPLQEPVHQERTGRMVLASLEGSRRKTDCGRARETSGRVSGRDSQEIDQNVLCSGRSSTGSISRVRDKSQSSNGAGQEIRRLRKTRRDDRDHQTEDPGGLREDRVPRTSGDYPPARWIVLTSPGRALRLGIP